MYKYHFLYQTTNLINGKIYVGIHSTDDLGSGIALINAIKKYGKENFEREILEFSNTRDEILQNGEKNSFYRKSHTEETKKKISEANSRKKRTDEFKKIKSEKMKEYWSENDYPHKGKTYEEVYGVEKAKELKEKRKNTFSKNRKDSSGANNPKAKLNDNMVIIIRLMNKFNKYTIDEMSLLFGVTKTTIRDIIKIKTWKNITI